MAFTRADEDVLVAVSRWTVRLSETGWGETTLRLPPGTWHDRITGAVHTAVTHTAALFADLPVALLGRFDA